MKRILAVFLTLAMALNIAPVAAFAAVDSDAASIVAVDENDETSSSQLDEETARAIASDPFLQAAYAQTEQKQTGQAEVDTSNMSVSATNSFGQLLVNGMEEQTGTSGTYTSRVTKVQLNGHTASVEFVADQTADLVVAIYTDDTAEEMVASGTVEVSGSGGNGAAKVTITGEIPETYTVKAFLLDKKEHTPLSEVYTDSSHTQVMVELSTAKASDFPEDRVVNLDGQDDTNFVVVKQNVTLISYVENPAGENVFAGEDGTGLVYVIEHASAEVKGLQKGDILTYEYAPGEMLIVQVSDIAVSGDAVTIYGDDTLDITDVFDAVKIENEADNDQLKYDGSTADAGVTYLGEEDADFSFVNEEGGGWLDDTNDFSVSLDTTDGFKKDPIELTGKASKKFEFQAYSGSDSSTDGDSTAQASIKGTVNVGISITSGFYIAKERKYFSLAANVAATADATASGEIEVRKRLGSFGFSPVAGCYIGIDPTFVSKAEVQMVFTIKTSAKIGFTYDSANGGIKNESKAPYIALSAKATGSLYAGIDLSPNIKILGKVTVLALKVELGETGSFSEAVWSKGNEDLAESIHGCSQCYTVDLSGSFEIGGSMTVLKKVLFDTTIFKKDDWNQGKAYSAPDYNDFGFGDCPHKKYRVTISVSTDGSEGMTVYATPAGKSKTELGKIGPALVLVAYLDPGSYTLTATKDDKTYGANITIEDAAQEIKLYLDGSGWIDQPTNPDPDKPDNPDAPDAPTNPDIPTGGTVVASGSCGAKGDNLTWTLDDNGLFTISGTGKMAGYFSLYYVPWAGYRGSIKYVWIKNGVTSIGANAFYLNNELMIVEIPDSVTSIGESAFERCNNLQEITLPENITLIAYAAFSNCTSLRKITIPKNVRSVGDSLFAGCTGLVSAEIMDGVPEIGYAMFNGCTNLRSVTIPESVASIGSQAFENCAGLSNVVIPNGVRSISDYAFKDCTNLARLTLPDELSSIGAEAFARCTSLRKVTLPESVIKVGVRAFYNCSSLSSVTIPEGVLQIEREAFALCGKLAAVAVPGTVTEIGEGVFKSCTGMKKAEIADGVLSIGEEAFINCISLTDLVLPESITSIGDSAFRECTSLTRMTIPESLSNIGANVFNGCRNLSEVTILDGVTSIGDGTFAGCRSLKRVVIPDSVQSIGYDAFYYCTNLAELDFPDGLQRIGGRAFYGCTSLKEISLPDSVTRMEDEAFRECSSLTSAALPAGLTRISYNAFRGCVGLTNITIPANVKTVDSGAFGACSRLTSVSLPDGLTTIEKGAFSGCVNLKEILIPESVTEIRGSAFEDCFSLKNVEIPGKVTDIGESTFRGCRNLESIGIPQSVNGIRAYAFYGCDSLKDIYYSGTKNAWNNISIFSNGNNRLSAATIHCTDGDIIPNTENSITTGTASTSDSKFQATFADAKAGKEYVVLVSRSDSDPLNADNLIYINQITADADGELVVPFITATAADAAEMTYVVACAQDAASIDPDQPDQPGGDEPSSGGGDGSGAAIILIGGIAVVAAITGVVLLMPVKVEGTVKLADQPVANATVQVLKNDSVEAQTTTDANGRFAVKVKRGGYTLRVQWMDAEGQPVVRTVDFKAPNTNLNVAA